MANVSFRMDDTLKHDMEIILDELGLNVTTAMTMFAKAIVRENGLPLDLMLDPFYSPINQNRLAEAAARYASGKSVPIVRHIEDLEAMESDE